MADITLEDKVVQIIELTQGRDFCPLDYLAESLGVGTRTVRNYIKNLNSDLEGIVALKNKRGKGFYLDIEDKSAFEQLVEKINHKPDTVDSPKRRIASIIDKLINSDEKYTLDELAFQMNIGRTTLVNELKKASVSLEAYNLKIYGKPNTGMNLSGDELDLRFFIIDNVHELLYGSYPLDQDIAEDIMNIAAQHDFEPTTQKKLMEFVVVMLDRLLNGKELQQMKPKHKALLHSNDYQIALDIVAAIEKTLPVTIPEEEVLFLTIPIAGRRTPTNSRTLTDIKVTNEVKRLLELIVEQIGFNKEVINENLSFFKDLHYHLTFMLNRLMFGLRLKNPMLADVKKKYPVAFRLSKIAGQVIENEYDLKASEDELGYIAFYFQIFISQSESKVKRLRKAAVICGTGRGTAKLVANQLQRVLNQNTELNLFSETAVTKEILDQHDIVFSTVKLSCDTETPVIQIQEVFDEYSVSRKIEEVTFLQSIDRKNESSNNHSILYHLISEESFFLLDPTLGYQANLYEMVDRLVDLNYFDEGFKERLKEREEKGSMVFDNHIALPHTFNYQSDQIELALGIFPNKVCADGKEVSLVFLLGVPEQQTDRIEHQLVSVYDEIIRIAGDPQVIEQLLNATNFEDVSRYLKQVSKY